MCVWVCLLLSLTVGGEVYTIYSVYNVCVCVCCLLKLAVLISSAKQVYWKPCKANTLVIAILYIHITVVSNIHNIIYRERERERAALLFGIIIKIDSSLYFHSITLCIFPRAARAPKLSAASTIRFY